MEEFIENEDLNDYMFSSLPEDCKLSDYKRDLLEIESSLEEC